MTEYIELEQYPGYYAGDDGHIYSKYTWGHNTIKPSNPLRQLKAGVRKDNRLLVVVRQRRPAGAPHEDYEYTKLVHHLIAEAFIGPRPEGTECSHIDGNCQNNVPSNLKWETHKENEKRKKGHGTHAEGSDSCRAKLTKEQVVEIRKMLAKKIPHRVIAGKFPVSAATISFINVGKRYVNE